MYNAQEISNQDGRPIALYEFRYGNTYWRFCTSDQDETVGLDENDEPASWLARAITDEGVTQGGSDQNDLQIVTQADNPVAGFFRNSQPSGKVWLSVRRWHRGDPDEETPLMWSGTVVNANLEDRATIRLVCRSLGGSYDRQGLRLAWGRMCPHVLYSPFGCRVDKTLHAYPYVLNSVTGNGFNVVAFVAPAEGSFSGGFLEQTQEDGSIKRFGIESQIGNAFRVLGSTDGLASGQSVVLYPGCQRDTEACKRFANLPNYGGFPHLPGKSPFDGSPVF